jgi:hypothetical protein
VDFIDEQNPAALDVREESRKVPGFFNHGAARGADFGSHGVANDVGERGFAETGRPAE